MVSIIVPCYNQGDYIAETLDSVLNQTVSDWECIVVNDGSTDNSESVILKYQEKDSRIKYIYKENSGVSATRNVAISASMGEFILPLDSDDKISNDYLELALKAFKSNPELKLVYCWARMFGEKNCDWDLIDYSYQQLILGNMIFCSAMFRKSDFLKSAGYDEEMKFGFEDWAFWIEFLDPDSKVYRIPKVCFYYRIKEESRNVDVNKQYDKKLDMYDRIFLRNYQKYVREANPLILNEKNHMAEGLWKSTKEYQMGRFVYRKIRRIKWLLGMGLFEKLPKKS